VFLVFALVPVLLLPLSGQTPTAPARRPQNQSGSAQAQETKPGEIRGTVLSSTGDPVGKATVMLSPVNRRGAGRMPDGAGPAGASATTDSTGNFAVQGVSPGSYTISARRTGFVAGSYGPKGAPKILELAEGQELTGVQIRLTPQAVISGKVVDEDGDPLQSASVQILKEQWRNGRKQHTPAGGVSTNDLGEYRVANLMPGRYHVVVAYGRQNPDGRAPRIPGAISDVNYTPNYYAGATDIDQATPLQLIAGQEMRAVDFQLRKTATWRIRGHVLDDSGRPARNVGVMAMPTETGYSGIRSTGMVRNSEGAFEIAGLPPGSYALVVNRSSRDEPRATARTVVQVGSRDLDGVVVQLARTFEITGVVRVVGEGVESRNSQVLAEPLEPGVTFFGGNDGRVKSDGTWSISGMSPGRYRISLNGLPEGTYLKSVMAGGQDITAGASVTAAASGIEVIVGTKAAEVTGTVLNVDKQPVAGSTVVLVPESSRLEQYWLFRTVTTDDTGSFVLQGIVPGQYTAYALAEVEDGIWNSPDFLTPLQGKGTSVRLPEGSHETVQLNPIS